MTPAAKRRRRLGRWLIGLASAGAIFGGTFLVVFAQKAGERRAFQAATAGPPCPSVAVTPAYVDEAALKTGAFQGARFAYLRGDMDCQTAQVGDLAGDYAPYCTFDRPGYLRAAYAGGGAGYQLAIGQMVLSRRADGRWLCTTRPPP